MLVSVGGARAADVAAASASSGTTLGEVIVTAAKREENLQKVAVSVQAIDTKAIMQLNITSFNDYVKFIPSLQAQSGGPPNSSIIYMRGISDGGNGNHSGPQPSVGTYLDEQPVTTIGARWTSTSTTSRGSRCLPVPREPFMARAPRPAP